jgi:putative transposase
VLVLAGGIRVRPVWSRDLPAAPSSVRVFRDAVGDWYASFVVDRPVRPLPETGSELGIDWGVKAVATATDPAFDLPHSHHGDKAAAAVARYQRQQARRRRARGEVASTGYKHASRRVAKLHRKVARQRQDEARKWASKIVIAHDVIAIEDFKPRFLAANRALARRGLDARIGAARRALGDAAAKHGRSLVVVPTAYTTMTCSCCGARATHRIPLSQRMFQCESCGHTQDRDRNAANNILQLATRAGLDPAGDDRGRQGELLAA